MISKSNKSATVAFSIDIDSNTQAYKYVFLLLLNTMNTIKMQIETSNDDFCTYGYLVCKNTKFLLIYETTLPIILVLRGSVLKNCL